MTYFILSIMEIKSPLSAYLIVMFLFVWRDFMSDDVAVHILMDKLFKCVQMVPGSFNLF